MRRHDTRLRAIAGRAGRSDLKGQGIAASALATACLTVVALYKTASGSRSVGMSAR